MYDKRAMVYSWSMFIDCIIGPKFKSWSYNITTSSEIVINYEFFDKLIIIFLTNAF